MSLSIRPSWALSRIVALVSLVAALAQRVTLRLLLAAALPAAVGAQTDYYNTDRNRPIRIEDAYATERYSFDAHLAPLRLERSAAGVYTWGVDPEIAFGILPRTQLEVGLPVAFVDMGASRRVGIAGLDVSVLYNLNAETTRLPALGVRARMLAPVGSLAADKAYSSLQDMLTRTYSWARFHINGEYTFGGAPVSSTTATTAVRTTPGMGATELSRWLAGAAVDRTFPLRSLLVTGEVYAMQPIPSDADVAWNAGAGLRYQLSPFLALDGGIGRRLTSDDRAWFVTFGVARVFALRGLMPRR
ncbi:MAG: hypothetical protein ABIT38_20365 [Gemmatimonadaceae bacterium]